MSEDARLIVKTDNYFESTRIRKLLESLPGFAARSSSFGSLMVEPRIAAKEILATLGDFVAAQSRYLNKCEEHVLQRGDHVLELSLNIGLLRFHIHSRTDNAREIVAELEKRFEPFRRENRAEDGVWVDFSYLGMHGVERTTQFLRAPLWEEICGNYPVETRGELEGLFGMAEPWKHGRLIIWHGPPGCGKTYAIRSLMMQWRERFDYTVVNDPERLTREPAYYYEVASDSIESPDPPLPRLDLALDDAPDPEPSRARRRKRRALFVLEDCADLILTESRANHFDKIGKLLNMTDGLFGQGREDLFLLTFNEDVKDIDPAFLRPGRCIAHLNFPRFDAAEATAWLRERNAASEDVAGELTLAEMFARVHRGNRSGMETVKEERGGKGFGAGKRL